MKRPHPPQGDGLRLVAVMGTRTPHRPVGAAAALGGRPAASAPAPRRASRVIYRATCQAPDVWTPPRLSPYRLTWKELEAAQATQQRRRNAPRHRLFSLLRSQPGARLPALLALWAELCRRPPVALMLLAGASMLLLPGLPEVLRVIGGYGLGLGIVGGMAGCVAGLGSWRRRRAEAQKALRTSTQERKA